MTDSNESKSKKVPFSDCVNHVTVEPILVLFSFGMGMFYVAAEMLYIEKVCKVNFNLSIEICDNLTAYEEEQVQVQKYVAELQAYNTIIQTIPSAILGLFAGPWSDIHGRKLLMVFPLIGYVVLNGVFLVNRFFFMELRAEFLLFEFLQDMTGGGVCFYIGAYAYLCEITTKQNRTKRLSFVNAISPLASCLGNLAGGYVKEYIGYYGNFGFGFLLALLSLFWAVFILKDSRDLKPPEKQQNIEQIKEEEEGKDEKESRSIFNLKNVKDSFSCTFKKRKGNLRRIVVSLFFAYILLCVIGNSGSVSYLFWRMKFKFSVIQLGSLWAAWGFSSLVVQYFFLPILSEKCQLQDSSIALLGLVSIIVYKLTIYLLPATGVPIWVFYLNEIISATEMFTWTTMRSLTTKCVNPSEFGKIFGVFGAVTSMLPLASAPMFAFIYKHTMESDPGTYLIVQMSLYILPMVILATITSSLRKHKSLTRRSTIKHSYSLTVVARRRMREASQRSVEEEAEEEDWDQEGAMEHDKFPQPILVRQTSYLHH